MAGAKESVSGALLLDFEDLFLSKARKGSVRAKKDAANVAKRAWLRKSRAPLTRIEDGGGDNKIA